MEKPIAQKIRDWFDELFLWSESVLKPATQELFDTLGITWFAEIYLQSKKYGFAVSQKILADLVKLSFVVYSNVDKFPIEKKVVLPQKNWSYKFVVTSLPHSLLRGSSDPDFAKEDTNVLFLAATGDTMHANIAAKMWLQWIAWQVNILWWAHIDIDHDAKTLIIHDDSGSYGSCSNQFVEWILEEYNNQWYTVTIAMTHQKEFFSD